MLVAAAPSRSSTTCSPTRSKRRLAAAGSSSAPTQSFATRLHDPEPCRPDRVLCSDPVATMTRMHTGFSGVVQHEWPRPRGWTPSQYLDTLDVQTLPGVGP